MGFQNKNQMMTAQQLNLQKEDSKLNKKQMPKQKAILELFSILMELLIFKIKRKKEKRASNYLLKNVAN